MKSRTAYSSLLIALWAMTPTSLPGQPVPADADAPARGVQVRVLSSDPPRLPLRARVIARNGSVSVEQETNSEGVARFADLACDDATEFRAEPESWLYAAPLDWIGCSGNPTDMVLRRHQIAAAIAPAFAPLPGQITSDAPELAEVHAQFAEAIADNKPGLAAIIANDLAARIQTMHTSDPAARRVASAYSLVAIEGWRRSANAAPGQGEEMGFGQLEDADVFRFDPSQDRFVPSPGGVEAVKRFQSARGLRTTGKFDWNTFRALDEAETYSPPDVPSDVASANEP